MARTRTYTGIGTLTAATTIGVAITTRYKVTRTLSGPEFVRTRQGVEPLQGGGFEDIRIELLDVTQKQAGALEKAESLMLTLRAGSQLPVVLMNHRVARPAGNAAWTEDEEFK